MAACTQCGEPHEEPGTICAWCRGHIQKELEAGPAKSARDADLSLPEALQWGETHELFAA